MNLVLFSLTWSTNEDLSAPQRDLGPAERQGIVVTVSLTNWCAGSCVGTYTANAILPVALSAVMDTIKLPLLPLGDPLLRMRSLPVRNPADPSVRSDVSLLLDIFRAFRRNYGFGQGIAAPQIGLLKRIIVIDPGSGGPMVMLNPEITWSSRQIVRQWES